MLKRKRCWILEHKLSKTAHAKPEASLSGAKSADLGLGGFTASALEAKLQGTLSWGWLLYKGTLNPKKGKGYDWAPKYKEYTTSIVAGEPWAPFIARL